MDVFLLKSPLDAQVLFVDDGSTDRSRRIIANICRAEKAYRFISLKQNSGLSAAIAAGVDRCETSLVGYIDADLQTAPLDLLTLLQHLPGHDMVNGIRTARQDKIIKKVSSKIANSFRKLVLADGIEDSCCPLKIIKTGFAKKLPRFTGMHRFIPALVQLEGGRVEQVPVRHFPRYAGQAKYNLRNRLIWPFIDTMAVVWIRKRHLCWELKD
jgi:glycosyltransferase involved in cell wall biosynthesis